MGEVSFLQNILNTDTSLLSQLQQSFSSLNVTKANYSGPNTQVANYNGCNLFLKSMYVKGKLDGIATLLNNDYEILMELPFNNGKLDGKVKIQCLQQSYAITYFDGNPTGEVMIKEQDSTLFEGLYNSGMANGKGTYYYSNGYTYTGLFQGGVANGTGSIYDQDGSVIISGVFNKGRLSNYKVECPTCIRFIGECVKPQVRQEEPAVVFSKDGLEFQDYAGIVECEVDMVSNEEFNYFLNTHAENERIMYSENNDNMTSSYIMLDAKGRFFNNIDNKYIYSNSLFDDDVDLYEEFFKMNYSIDKYYDRYKKAN